MALFFKTKNQYQGFVPDVLLPMKDKVKNLHWIITDIETYYNDTIFGCGKNLCLTTEELLALESVDEIQLLWGVFSAVYDIPTNYNDISIYNNDDINLEIDYYSDQPILSNALIEIHFDDASGYWIKSKDKEFYEIYMNYYKDFKLY